MDEQITHYHLSKDELGPAPEYPAPVCPSCGVVAVWMGNYWESAHTLDCTWMADPDSEEYG